MFIKQKTAVVLQITL